MSEKMKVVLHCSDSSFGNAATIALWHGLPKPVGRGWSGIGYHFVVLNGQISAKAFHQTMDGHLETGRPLNDDHRITSDEYGAHTLGLNRKSVGICLIGKSGRFTDAQYSSLLNVLFPLLQQQFGALHISQHADHDAGKPHCAGLNPSYIKEMNELFGR